MIISHQNKFIFIKTKKTAGSSVEIVLSKYCGLNDVIPPLSRAEDEYRKNEYGVDPINYKFSAVEFPKAFLATLYYEPKGCIRFIKNPFKYRFPLIECKYPEHGSAVKVKKIVGKSTWNRYLKFSIERNPWDKAVSRYYWDLDCGRVKGKSLDEHIEFLAEKDPKQLSNWTIYADGDEILVDEVLLYEELEKGLKRVGDKLELKNLRLPTYRAKSTFRKDRRPAGGVLDKNSKQIIHEICHKEIEYFGYSCPEATG